MKKKKGIKVVKRKRGLEGWWLRQVRGWKHFVSVGRWVLLGAALMWVVLVVWK